MGDLNTQKHYLASSRSIDGTMHALTLPSLESVPSTIIPTMRGVVSVILNDDELDYGQGSEEKTDMTVVIVRRRVLGIYRLGNRLQSIKVCILNHGKTWLLC